MKLRLGFNVVASRDMALCLLLVALPAQAMLGVFERGPFPVIAADEAVTDIAIANLGGSALPEIYIARGNLLPLPDSGGVERPARDSIYWNVDGGFHSLPTSAVPLDDAVPQPDTGVALADFNGDGLIDAAMAGGAAFNGNVRVAASSRVYRNLGGSSFAAAQLFGNVSESTAIAAGDWDNDGDPDLALARASGVVDLYRNDTPPSSATFVFTFVQQLAVSSVRAGSLAFGHFFGGAALHLVVLRPRPDPAPSSRGSGVSFFLNAGGSAPFVAQQDLNLNTVELTDLAVGNVDDSGSDDVVVAGDAGPNANESASRVLLWRAGGAFGQFVVDGLRFPAGRHRAVALGDVNGDGRSDIVFAQRRCAPDDSECHGREVSTIAVWLRFGNAYVHNAQCLGRHGDGALAVAIADLDGDARVDLFVAGTPELLDDFETSEYDRTRWWRNDAATLSGECCFAQYAALYLEGLSGPGLKRGVSKLINAVAAVDLDALARVRDELMPDAANGTRLRARYQTFSSGLVAMMRTNPSLWSDAAQVLNHWSAPVRALIDGHGNNALVSATMIAEVDAFLQRLSGSGTAALAQAIAEERALLPPFASLVGLNMNAFRDLVLPLDVTFRDGFESP